MSLLDAAAATLPASALQVATFDHATGPHAREASGLVERRAREFGLRVTVGRATRASDSEAEWRQMRWEFLRRVAVSVDASIVTAHTRDDQVETVLMRVMRDAGARGIAGLFASPTSRVIRPLLATSRAELAAYARAAGVEWVEDPSNASPRHLRNRVRRDLLPALRAENPHIDDELLELARRAALWRTDVETFVNRHVSLSLRHETDVLLGVASETLAEYSQPVLAVLWPAIVARVGLALDHRGTRRLVAFTRSGRVGSRVQLSGGWEIVRSRHRFELLRVGTSVPEPIELEKNTDWGRWRFRQVEEARSSDAWTARLPIDRRIIVRRWLPGDTMIPAAGRTPRKVKRLLSSAGVTGHERSMWPVVLAGDEIVWIPGVRRSDAATDRPGRPVLTYRCEFDDR